MPEKTKIRIERTVNFKELLSRENFQYISDIEIDGLMSVKSRKEYASRGMFDEAIDIIIRGEDNPLHQEILKLFGLVKNE